MSLCNERVKRIVENQRKRRQKSQQFLKGFVQSNPLSSQVLSLSLQDFHQRVTQFLFFEVLLASPGVRDSCSRDFSFWDELTRAFSPLS
jgi:hypothetical protein